MNSMLEKVAGVGRNILKGVGIGAGLSGLASLGANAIGNQVGYQQGLESDSYKGKPYITKEEKKSLSKHRFPERDSKAMSTLVNTYKERNPKTGQRIWGALSGKRSLYSGRGMGVSERMDAGYDRAHRTTQQSLEEIKREIAANRIPREWTPGNY